MGDARGNYQELLPLKLITVKRNLLPGTEGGSFFAGGEVFAWEVMRDMEGDGASRFWETVPEAGRFFCAIVGL